MDNPRILTPEEVADMLHVTSRRVLQLPIKQLRLGHRTVRFRLRDVYEYLGVDDPNSEPDDSPMAAEAPE